MTPAEFKKKWLRYRGKETAAYSEHFNDLCALLGQQTPAEADPSGNDWFCFQKRVVKDLELFAADDTGAEPAVIEALRRAFQKRRRAAPSWAQTRMRLLTENSRFSGRPLPD